MREGGKEGEGGREERRGGSVCAYTFHHRPLFFSFLPARRKSTVLSPDPKTHQSAASAIQRQWQRKQAEKKQKKFQVWDRERGVCSNRRLGHMTVHVPSVSCCLLSFFPSLPYIVQLNLPHSNHPPLPHSFPLSLFPPSPTPSLSPSFSPSIHPSHPPSLTPSLPSSSSPSLLSQDRRDKATLALQSMFRAHLAHKQFLQSPPLTSPPSHPHQSGRDQEEDEESDRSSSSVAIETIQSVLKGHLARQTLLQDTSP